MPSSYSSLGVAAAIHVRDRVSPAVPKTFNARTLTAVSYWMARAYLEKGLAMFDREDMNETELQRYFKDVRTPLSCS